MKLPRPNTQTRCAFLIGALTLLGACTQGVRLSEDDRAGLAGQPAIHVRHYETPLPRLKAGATATAPTPAAVRKHAAADPAALLAQNFSRLIGKKEKLKNLHIEPRALPRPVAKDANAYREKYRRGLVLEFWVDEWSFAPLATDFKTYAMTLVARSRLTRVEDGRVLWSTGGCNADGHNNNRELRLAEKELTTGTKLRKLLVAARDECARQLLRDFGVRGPG